MEFLAISRLKLRKKTVPETLRPLLSDLESTIQLIPRHEILASGRDLITAISLAIQKISVWVNTHSANPGEVKKCQVSFDSTQLLLDFGFLKSCWGTGSITQSTRNDDRDMYPIHQFISYTAHF